MRQDGAFISPRAAGDEIINGTSGDDVLRGKGLDNDTISGFEGNDELYGKNGNDVLIGGAGNDLMEGGKDADTFVIGTGDGADTITDFTSGEDVLDLFATGVHDLTGLISDDANGNAFIDLGGGNSVTLEGISTAQFLADPNNVILADPPPSLEDVFLGVNDTYLSTNYAAGTDQQIFADNAGEGDTDTDLFVFDIGTGNDIIVDFQYETFDFGGVGFIPGDTMDLDGYGVHGGSFSGLDAKSRLTSFRDDAAHTRLVEIMFELDDGSMVGLDALDPLNDVVVASILQLDDDATPDGVADSSVKLLGIDLDELDILVSANLDTGV